MVFLEIRSRARCPGRYAPDRRMTKDIGTAPLAFRILNRDHLAAVARAAADGGFALVPIAVVGSQR